MSVKSMGAELFDKLCIFSYNSRGFGIDKQDILKVLAVTDGKSIPIICNQENFLLRNNSYKVKQCLTDSHIYFKSAEMDSVAGRPKNGMFIAVPLTLKETIKDVSPNHWRIQAVVVSGGNSKILIINTYFPTDPRINDFDTSDLMSTLDAINETLANVEFDNVVWAGDLNADFGRNSKFTSLVDDFTKDKGLLRAWDRFMVSYTHATEIDGKTYTSKIDHFHWNESMDSSVTDAGALYLPGDTSDHCPIYCVIKTNDIKIKTENAETSNPKPSWAKATNEQKDKFAYELESKLQLLCCQGDGGECSNVQCNSASHMQSLDEYLMNLLQCMNTAAEKCLPSTGRSSKTKKKDKIPQWNKDIQPYKDNAVFWNAIWQSAGKPMNNQLHSIMKRTRNIYHYQIRKNKRMVNTMKRNSILEACFGNDNLDLFAEIRKLRRCPATVATEIDGVSENVPEHFAAIYKDLYNSVSDEDEIGKIKELLNNRINISSMVEVRKVTSEVVRDAVFHLKAGKSDPVFQFGSDCLKNAPTIFYDHLAEVFKCFLIHGHVSSVLTLSTMIPLVKDKLGDICASNNYRSIALSSLILKIFDWVIILLYGDKLNLDSLQFGYQPNVSTNMCTWAAVETIQYFLRNGSNVYACALDMSKAFDRVKHSVLFEKLLDRNLPDIYVRLLIHMYREQTAKVRWNKLESKEFAITNGVKQGAVLSAILYCLYVNDLYKLLRKNKYGCWVNGDYFGILGYSDDILLQAPSVSALKKILKTCETFAQEHNLQFSTNPNPAKSKCKCIGFGKDIKEQEGLTLCGNVLPWVNKISHLGTTITNEKDVMAKDIMQKRAGFINRNNELQQEFYFAHPRSLMKINGIYNTSFYGCVLWNQFGKEMERVDKSWNVSLRRMMRIPFNAHRYLLEPVSESKHVIFSLYARFLNFTDKLKACTKSLIRNLFRTVKVDCRSTTGHNLRKIMLKTNNVSVDDIKVNEIKSQSYYRTPEYCSWRVNFVKEIQEIRFGNLMIPNVNNEELTEILKDVSTL